ncbi:MAG TPA: class I SAM-dependent methyltransferase [Marmoricola sp.]|nr:class I SAM-dependent methyltransferase [Marmoricola sp.]
MTREDETRRLARTASDEDPTGWFEQLYVAARSGAAAIPWDRGGPNPLLAEWTAHHGLDGTGRTAVTVGCGLGDDAEHLAGLGFVTTAFDISPTAVETARERHPGSRVSYTTADLLDLPAEWRASYDVVFESLTVQSMPVSVHQRAIEAVRSLLAPGGTLLVISGHREEGAEVEDGPPWPLVDSEIHAFASDDVHVRQLEVIQDQQDPSVRRWRVELHRDA